MIYHDAIIIIKKYIQIKIKYTHNDDLYTCSGVCMWVRDNNYSYDT